MVVNEVAGEECRIAILEDYHLEELYTERVATATKVGNIYKGRVVNVEPAIQAAFIDYGEGVNGFLHISDLHPRYFPGAGRTERVGRKIPRRERPPMQEALRRGDEVLVQVLKEGLGTKGPTLTSYLSIPGRLLVMMPEMDRVGVSRKVEDEEGRREMRKVLDTLDLPEGFGFILRTAGVGKTKTELKRDVAYLTRLWKVMAKRIDKVGAPCELYTESDLLIRTVRDVLRPTIGAIVVDSDSAYDRVSLFLNVIAPRSAPKVVRYRRPAPIFHSFDIERQIDLIHSRSVPLPSGGALVIDQTEALVAIDVNSGRSRGARDSETNAYQTNCEAVDEICRQLRLRDLGGLIIHDLIDMRYHRHRRLIEDRFAENLKRDRARSTILRISEFGLAEMTRQRMRPSMRKSHFVSCSHCDGHGEIKAPDSVAADVTRHAGYLLAQDRVRRVEIVCSTRVASVLLSRRRRELVRLEDGSGKAIDVRVSDHIGHDGVEYYAYDDRNSDIDLTHLPAPRPPSLKTLIEEDVPPAEDETPEAGSKTGRRRRRRRGGPADASAVALAAAAEIDWDLEEEEDGETGTKKKRSRRRRGRRQDSGDEEAGATATGESHDAMDAMDAMDATDATDETTETDKPRRRRGRRGGRGRGRGRVDAERTDARETGETETPTGTGTATEAATGAGIPAAPIRVHELAKLLGVPSRDVLARCAEDGTIECKNHMSSVSAEDAATIRAWFQPADVAQPSAADVAQPSAADVAEPTATDDGDATPEKGKRRRRRRRGGRGRARSSEPNEAGEDAGPPAPPEASAQPSDGVASVDGDDDAAAPPKKSRRGRRGGRRSRSGATTEDAGENPTVEVVDATTERQSKPSTDDKPTENEPSSDKPAPKKRRTLYSSRRKLSPGQFAEVTDR